MNQRTCPIVDRVVVGHFGVAVERNVIFVSLHDTCGESVPMQRGNYDSLTKCGIRLAGSRSEECVRCFLPYPIDNGHI